MHSTACQRPVAGLACQFDFIVRVDRHIRIFVEAFGGDLDAFLQDAGRFPEEFAGVRGNGAVGGYGERLSPDTERHQFTPISYAACETDETVHHRAQQEDCAYPGRCHCCLGTQ